jgi:two-component system, NtrC family, sensor kinase
MSLSVKISFIICGIFLLMVALFHIVTTSTIMGSFLDLEKKNITTNLSRVLNTLEQDLAGLESTGGDWAAWNDTRDFIIEQKKEYIESNLNVSTFENIRVNFMIFLNNSGELLYSYGIKFGDEAEETVVSEELLEKIQTKKSLISHKDARDAKTGFMLLSETAVILTTWPISNNEMDGPITGTLIMGRYFDDVELKSLEDRTQLEVAFQRTDTNQIPADFMKAASDLDKGNKSVINRDLADTVSGFSYFKDIYGNDSLIVKVSRPRDIYKQGQSTTNFFRWVQFIAVIIVLVTLLLTLQFAVLKPILRLKEHVLSVGKSGDLSVRLALKSRDEIGALAGEFNRMLEQLSEARNRLMEQSYYSGIGEMASGILHNLRNILTPIIGQIEKINTRLKDAPLKNIEQAIDELNSCNTAPEREKSLKKYLSLAVPRLSNTTQDIHEGLMIISGQATYMEEVLSQQDKLAYHQKVLEPLNIRLIIEDSIKLMPHNLINAADIHIADDLDSLPHVSAERIVLLQVLTNILHNASESILRKGLQKGNIWISGTSNTEGEIQKVHILIKDDGEGIEKESLKKIFNSGFSTKAPRSSGIGLHWCSNVLSAMKADIFAGSDGIGHGCIIHIRIPVDNNRLRVRGTDAPDSRG